MQKTEKKWKNFFFESIVKDFRKDMIEDGYYKYEVVIQDVTFRTYMTDDELKRSIELSLDLIEELKEINNNGMDREALDKIEAGIDDSNIVSKTMKIYHAFCTDKIYMIMEELDMVRRVSGAYAMLIANPVLSSAIYSVYDRLIDNFDNEKLYLHSAYFLLRAIMKMNSDEIAAE